MNYSEKGIDIIVGTTLPTLDLFRDYKNGSDAFYLFFLYLKQSRCQDTKETFSLDKFMMKATGRGENKFRKAKKVLKDLGMIKQIKKHKPNGDFQGWYVGISHEYRLNSSTTKKQSVQNSSTAKSEVQNAPVEQLVNAPVEQHKPVEEENKDNYTDEFLELRGHYPHCSSRSKKQKSFTSFQKIEEKQNLLREVLYLKWSVLIGLQDGSYVGGMQVWLNNYAPKNDLVFKNQMTTLSKYFDENGWDSELAKEYVKDRGKPFLREVKSIYKNANTRINNILSGLK